MDDLWYPQAARIDGPAWKRGYTDTGIYRIGKGAVVHSAEGQWIGMLARLDSTDQASWHFSLLYDGLIQHYPLQFAAWHAGGYANRRWFGVECEGRAGEVLTEKQVARLCDLLKWASQAEAWPGFILQKDTGQLHEHRWYMATACPSNRIPWTRILEELTMTMRLTPEEALKFNAQVAYHLNDSRDLSKIATVIQYIYRVKGWPWPVA
jgi:N-acetyl-anhydromuramyl-L-alanine amidase AmpD